MIDVTMPAKGGRRAGFGRLAVLGLQHVLVMYTGCVTVPLVFGAAAGLDAATIAVLINADLLVAGVVTTIQGAGVGRFLGVRMPVMAGAAFTAVTPMILIAGEYGLQAVYGSMLAAGVFGLLIAYPFAKAVRFFPPLVSGVVITVVGLALIGVGVNLVVGSDPKAAGHAAPSRLALAAFVVLVILLAARFGRGFFAQTGVLLGLLAGTAVAVPLGLVDFSAARTADWIGLSAPFHFGAPEFPAVAVLSMCVVMLVLFAESTADLIAVAELTGKRLTTADMARGLAADGLSGVLGGVMNAFLDTVFAQNVGLVTMTKVRSRHVATIAGGILVLLGLVPKLGAWVAGLPQPVVGAAGLVMFATVAAVGISTLRKVDFDGTQNLLIVAVSIGVGMAPEVAPDLYSRFPEGVGIVLGSPVTSATLLAFCLNLAFNGGNAGRDAGLVRAPAAERKREAPAGRTRV
ncbi:MULTISPECIES: nucleobase:cation symporter-2 family protein [Streptomyces]|uniref:nucleobase:cation symporter-2 family protein n=1 Tax=Streptomyces TaxID=1883 RepID=UPI001671CA30|nr:MULTISPECIES: nucleobase:cation symporter-2 family protein [Streptomyces]MBK3522743.1 purine permease [Streptomyces sp. MBT70]GGR58470.1 xanthine/uracil permease [Streptomyces eurythermus]